MQQLQIEAELREWTPWPPNDTEESVAGSEIHQRVIDVSRGGLDMAALVDEATWHVQSRIPLAGFSRPDGSPYTMLPDVFVHPFPYPHPGIGKTLTIAELGVPLLVIEVLSDTTFKHDLDERRGKAWSYGEAGVSEYLIVDYGLQYMPEHVKALRLRDDRWVPWLPSPEGRWESLALGVSFSFDGLYLRVHDRAGNLLPRPYEAHALQRKQEMNLREREGELRERDALLERIRALTLAGDFDAVRRLLESSEPRP